MINRIRILVMILCMSLITLLGGTATAVAASVVQPERLISATTMPMTIAGFDTKVAAAHGFAIRTDSKGRLVSVPVTASAKASVSPNNMETGNCGSSWVYIYDVGVKKYRVDTGFGVQTSAINYTWYVNIVGPHYDITPHWQGGLAFSTVWSTSYYGTVSYGGTYSAKAWGQATLWNGSVCVSMGPIDNQAIY